MGEARIARMMSRMDVSRPPGVSICSTTIRLPLARAASSALVTYRDVAGPMAPLISRTVAVAARTLGAALVSWAGDAADGVLAARTEFGISAMIAITASPAKAARAVLTRSWERAERAFTLLTLLPSYAGRSRCPP